MCLQNQVAAMEALERRLRLASSNNTALQRQQAQLMEAVHALVHTVAAATGRSRLLPSGLPTMPRDFLSFVGCFQCRRHGSSCGGTVQMFTRPATPTVGCTTSPSATDRNLCRYDPPERPTG